MHDRVKRRQWVFPGTCSWWGVIHSSNRKWCYWVTVQTLLCPACSRPAKTGCAGNANSPRGMKRERRRPQSDSPPQPTLHRARPHAPTITHYNSSARVSASHWAVTALLGSHARPADHFQQTCNVRVCARGCACETGTGNRWLQEPQPLVCFRFKRWDTTPCFKPNRFPDSTSTANQHAGTSLLQLLLESPECALIWFLLTAFNVMSRSWTLERLIRQKCWCFSGILHMHLLFCCD